MSGRCGPCDGNQPDYTVYGVRALDEPEDLGDDEYGDESIPWEDQEYPSSPEEQGCPCTSSPRAQYSGPPSFERAPTPELPYWATSYPNQEFANRCVKRLDFGPSPESVRRAQPNLSPADHLWANPPAPNYNDWEDGARGGPPPFQRGQFAPIRGGQQGGGRGPAVQRGGCGGSAAFPVPQRGGFAGFRRGRAVAPPVVPPMPIRRAPPPIPPRAPGTCLTSQPYGQADDPSPDPQPFNRADPTRRQHPRRCSAPTIDNSMDYRRQGLIMPRNSPSPQAPFQRNDPRRQATRRVSLPAAQSTAYGELPEFNLSDLPPITSSPCEPCSPHEQRLIW